VKEIQQPIEKKQEYVNLTNVNYPDIGQPSKIHNFKAELSQPLSAEVVVE